jgi:hypothetical protein
MNTTAQQEIELNKKNTIGKIEALYALSIDRINAGTPRRPPTASGIVNRVDYSNFSLKELTLLYYDLLEQQEKYETEEALTPKVSEEDFIKTLTDKNIKKYLEMTDEERKKYDEPLTKEQRIRQNEYLYNYTNEMERKKRMKNLFKKFNKLIVYEYRIDNCIDREYVDLVGKTQDTLVKIRNQTRKEINKFYKTHLYQDGQEELTYAMVQYINGNYEENYQTNYTLGMNWYYCMSDKQQTTNKCICCDWEQREEELDEIEGLKPYIV